MEGAARRLGFLSLGRAGLSAVQDMFPGAGIEAGPFGGFRDQDAAAHARVGHIVRGDPLGRLVAEPARVGPVETPCA